MIKKIVWMIVSCLMVIALTVSSCGSDEETEVTESTGISPETPKIGGMLTAMGADLTVIDPTGAQAIRVGHMMFTSNELMEGDWTKGPAGTGETAWDWGFLGDMNLMAGELCESWELPDDETIIYNLREGILYQDREPANGREMTRTMWSGILTTSLITKDAGRQCPTRPETQDGQLHGRHSIDIPSKSKSRPAHRQLCCLRSAITFT
jgi:hypothetical protein